MRSVLGETRFEARENSRADLALEAMVDEALQQGQAGAAHFEEAEVVDGEGFAEMMGGFLVAPAGQLGLGDEAVALVEERAVAGNGDQLARLLAHGGRVFGFVVVGQEVGGDALLVGGVGKLFFGPETARERGFKLALLGVDVVEQGPALGAVLGRAGIFEGGAKERFGPLIVAAGDERFEGHEAPVQGAGDLRIGCAHQRSRIAGARGAAQAGSSFDRLRTNVVPVRPEPVEGWNGPLTALVGNPEARRYSFARLQQIERRGTPWECVVEKTDFLNVFEGLEGSELIQDTFLFEKLNFDEAAGLASQFELRAYESGQTILEQNAIGESLYLVKSGKVAVIKSDGEHEQQLAELGQGELFGEMSLVETELTSASVRAVGKAECLVLPKFAIEQIMTHDRDFSLKIYQAFCKILSERLRRTTQDLFEARKGR